MSSKSTKPGWSMSPVDFGRSLKGFGINLLVTHMESSINFSTQVLKAKIVYWNEDFAVLAHGDTQWMLHTDHTYSHNSYLGIAQGQEARGTGVELRLYNLDPDQAEDDARKHDHIIFAGSSNKPHGLRECYILDPDGFCWVPSRPLTDDEVKDLE